MNDGLQTLGDGDVAVQVTAQVNREDERVLTGVRPVGDGGIGLADHLIQQRGEQATDVARQVGIDARVLDPCVLAGVVQLVEVGQFRAHRPIGVLLVQHLMHHEPDVALNVNVEQHRIISHISEEHIARPVCACGRDVVHPFDVVAAYTQLSGDLAGQLLDRLFKLVSKVAFHGVLTGCQRTGWG